MDKTNPADLSNSVFAVSVTRMTEYKIHYLVELKLYSVSQNPPSPPFFLTFFSKWLGIFSANFTRLLCVPIYGGLQIFIQLYATLTKLRHQGWQGSFTQWVKPFG